MGDDDLMLPDPTLPFGSGVIGVCDICGKRQAVVILEKERYQLCVLDFLNKSWKNSTALPGRPLPPYRSERCWFESSASPGVPAQGILLTPTKMVRRPGILVVSDLYGLTTMVLDAGVRLARVGFEVFLPDLGKIASIGITDQIGLRADVLLRGGVRLESPRVRRLVGLYADALEFLRHRPMVDPRKVGLFGASYGASLALGLAGRDAQISALALASPRPVSPPEFLRLLNAPVLLLVGGRDAAAARARRQIESARASVGFELELGGFPRAGPLFLARDATGYDLATAEGGWARTLAFLQGRLLPPPPKPPVPPVTRSLPPAVPAGAPPPPTTPRPGAAPGTPAAATP